MIYVLLNTRFVKSFVIGNKNDFNDAAAAIFDAVTRPNRRIAAIKKIEQQDVQLVHNMRQGLVGNHTALVNQIRGMVSERGIIIPQEINRVRAQLRLILEGAENDLTVLSREVFPISIKT
ncbi:hypothetical protein [Methyloprofundus sp.]|uniref:hypothetical protein n=1 Tax=Methyloprofundus sp. TaxID=2020875 RepID=UPI003D13DEDA